MYQSPSLDEVFELCCEAFERGMTALLDEDDDAFAAEREVHMAYSEMHVLISNGGMIH